MAKKKEPLSPVHCRQCSYAKDFIGTHASVKLKVIGYAHVTGTEGYVRILRKNNNDLWTQNLKGESNYWSSSVIMRCAYTARWWQRSFSA